MDQDSGKQRGRPASPTQTSPGQYLRGLRTLKNWTIRELARRVDLPESSAAYISQLESGDKVPNPELAEKLATQLADDLGVFRLWAMIARRSNPIRAVLARRELARLLNDPTLMFDPRFGGTARARYETSQERLAQVEIGQMRTASRIETPLGRWVAQSDALSAPAAATSARTFRVAILPEGTDPGPAEAADANALEALAIEFVRVDLDAITGTSLHRPFAYRLSAKGAARAASVLREGDVVVITRAPGPVARHEIHAVRHAGRLLLTHAAWNGRELLLLPDEDRSDFVVLPAPDKVAVERIVVGHVAKVIREGLAPIP